MASPGVMAIQRSKQVLEQRTLWNGAGEIIVNTRAAAAAVIAPMKPNMLRRVNDYVSRRGEFGATDEEIAYGLRMRDSTARARRVELRDGGQVRDSLRRRRSRAGRLCVVWVHTGEPLT